eukprot:Hpha_TRINITY_DN12303_c0_g1::TRINITY_DN12303_c0_g1_i1::g.156107::m.156107
MVPKSFASVSCSRTMRGFEVSVKRPKPSHSFSLRVLAPLVSSCLALVFAIIQAFLDYVYQDLAATFSLIVVEVFVVAVLSYVGARAMTTVLQEVSGKRTLHSTPVSPIREIASVQEAYQALLFETSSSACRFEDRQPTGTPRLDESISPQDPRSRSHSTADPIELGCGDAPPPSPEGPIIMCSTQDRSNPAAPMPSNSMGDHLAILLPPQVNSPIRVPDPRGAELCKALSMKALRRGTLGERLELLSRVQGIVAPHDMFGDCPLETSGQGSANTILSDSNDNLKDVKELERQLTHGAGRSGGLDSDSSEEFLTFQGIDHNSYAMDGEVLGRGAYGVVRRCLKDNGEVCAAKSIPLPCTALGVPRKDLLIPSTYAMSGLKLAGWRVVSVQEGSPAEAAGITPGTEIVQVNGDPVLNMLLPPSKQKDPLVELEKQDVLSLTVINSCYASRYRRAVATVTNALQELALLAGLRSPSIVQLRTCALIPGSMVMIMELASGGSLTSIVSSFGIVPKKAVQRYGVQMLTGLTYLHGKGVMHRDFKTANVLLGEGGVCKLSDFGCALRISVLTEEASDTVVGTVRFLAPEAARGEATFESDIWSFGIVLLELLTGTIPFGDLPDGLCLKKLAHNLIRPDVPESLDETTIDLLSLCFQIESKNRDTAKELLAHQYFTDTEEPVNSTPTWSTSPSPFRGTSPRCTRS